MTGSLLAGDALKVLHFCRDHRRPDEADLFDARRIGARLVVLDEQLNVLYTLELDEPQWNDDAIGQRLGVLKAVKEN